MSRLASLSYYNELINSRALTNAIGVLFFLLATILGAYVRIPLNITPVPITLQTFFVMLAGAVLGKRMGSISQFAYVILGVAGLPIFQGFAFGTVYILGPTGGYLIGFIIAAYLIGLAVRGYVNKGLIIAYFAIGDFIIHSCGTLWLMFIYKMDIIGAAKIGILPFIPGEMVKILLAALVYSKISQRSKALFSA